MPEKVELLKKVSEINAASFGRQKEISKKRAETILAERIKNQHAKRGSTMSQRVSGLQKLGSGGRGYKKKSGGIDLQSLLGGS